MLEKLVIFMYLEKLRNEYKTLEENIKNLEESNLDINGKNEVIGLRKELINLSYKIKKEELFNSYRSHKPMNYHFIDSDGSEIDVMLDYGDVNYESAYKQARNKILEDEIWDVMNYERENPTFENTSIEVNQKNNNFSDNSFAKQRYLVFKVMNNIHIIGDASINYLKNNVNLIKKYLNDKKSKFILHNDDLDEMIIDGVLVKVSSDNYTLNGNVDEYESSETINVINSLETSNKSLSDDEPKKDDSDKKKLDNLDTVILDDKDAGKKEANAFEFINLMREDKYSDILKLIGFYGISALWNSFDDGIKSGSVSKDDCNDFVNYLKGKIPEKSSFYGSIFNGDFNQLHDKYFSVDDLSMSSGAQSPIPAKPVKRKKAKKSLIDKFKGLSKGKKVAVVIAGAIAVVGIGILASHMIPMIVDKINANDAVNNTSPENYKVVTHVSKNLINNFMDKAHENYQLVKESVPHFNTINAGDTVFSSASDSISGINGVSASSNFRDTVVAVFDNATQKVIKITSDNIDSVRGLLDDPNVPKAFGDSFTPGNVSGWKTGTGYKTIVDAVKMVGGRSL